MANVPICQPELGKLVYLLAWQSLNGHLQLQYHDSPHRLVQHIRHLRGLGRTPIAYVRIDIEALLAEVDGMRDPEGTD